LDEVNSSYGFTNRLLLRHQALTSRLTSGSGLPDGIFHNQNARVLHFSDAFGRDKVIVLQFGIFAFLQINFDVKF